MKRLHKTAASVIVGMSLVACSGEPSGSDIKTLVEKEVKPAMEMQWKAMSGFSALMGGGQKSTPPTLDDVKKVGCKEDGDKAYKCDVELVVATDGKKESKVVPIRFVKASSGWQVSR